jgi:chaperonin cofactor prefoldin
MNAIWNTIDELRSQIHPDDEEAHYQLDRLEDQIQVWESKYETLQAEIEELKGGQAHANTAA